MTKEKVIINKVWLLFIKFIQKKENQIIYWIQKKTIRSRKNLPSNNKKIIPTFLTTTIDISSNNSPLNYCWPMSDLDYSFFYHSAPQEEAR